MTKKFYTTLSFVAVIIGLFMGILDTTIINIVIHEMTQYFDATVSNMSWIIFSYYLAFAVVLLSAARIADQFGRKKVFLVGVFLFSLTSFLCGLSSSLETIIIFRVFQGIAGAIMVPITIPLVLGLFPREQHAKVLGVWAGVSGLAAASGPVLGGILSSAFRWQAVFFVNVPIGIICFALTAWLIKESYDKTASKRIDWLGMITMSVSLFALTLGLILVPEMGWTSPYELRLFAISLATLILFVIVEQKIEEPMLPVSLFLIGPFVGSIITLIVLSAGMMCGSFLMALFLTSALEMPQLQAGLVVMFQPLSFMVASYITGYLSNKVRARVMGVMGMMVTALAIFLFSGVKLHSTSIDIIWRLIIAGAGIGLTLAPITRAAVHNVPPDKIGMASGVTMLIRVMGMILGASIMISIYCGVMNNYSDRVKVEMINQIESNLVLDDNLKEDIINEISNTQLSHESGLPSFDNILQKADTSKKRTLKRKEISNILLDVKDRFRGIMSSAFSSTFQVMSLTMLIGILSAFFCEKSKKSEASVIPVVNVSKED